MTAGLNLSRYQGKAVRLRTSTGGVGFSRRNKVPMGRLWPNGQFSVGWTYEAEELVREGEEWAWLPGSKAALNNLVNSPKFSQGRRGKPQGQKGITSYGRKMVANAAYLMQRELGRENLGFGTLTVPDMPDENLKRLNERWGEVTRQLQQQIGRMLLRGRGSKEVCYVTEVCGKRLQSSGRVYLHIHLVFQSRSSGGTWCLQVDELRKFWTELLSRVSGFRIAGWARIKLEVVKSSAEGYIGKYMSKGGEILGVVIESGMACMLPKSWWGMTKEMRERLKRSVHKGRGLGERLLKVVDDFVESEYCNKREMFVLPSLLRFEGRSVLIGWYGRLSVDVAEWIAVK